METTLAPPTPFTYDVSATDMASGNISSNWEKWKKSFKIYFNACELDKKTPSIQVNILLHIIGQQCRDILDQLESEITIEDAFKRLDEHFKIKKNLTVERHKFFIRNQDDNETIDQYVFELKKLAKTCEFCKLNDELIKDRLVCGVKSSSIRERLLREEDLTLVKALDICRAAVISKVYSDKIKQGDRINEVQSNNEHEINTKICAVGNKPKANMTVARSTGSKTQDSKVWNPNQRRGFFGNARPFRRPVANRLSMKEGGCYRCGTRHNKYECPAFGKKCSNCLRMNHFARVCSINYIEKTENQVIHSVTTYSNWYETLKINDNYITFKLDTGADVNIIPAKFLPKLGINRDNLLKTNANLSGYSGDNIKVIGKLHLKVFFRNEVYLLEFEIVDVLNIPLLGRHACEELNVLRRVMSVQVKQDDVIPIFITEFEDVFQGIGCLPGTYKIQLKENSVPVVHAPRKIPFALKDKLKDKLMEMVSQNIITKVEGPSDWVNSITIVKKPNGDLRICLDPKELNEAIKREYFRLPTLDEILSNLSGSCYFSTLDAKSGFWNVRLDESSDYCTFNTPFGRYKFLRMPFGICSASEVFHKKMLENFDDIEGVCMYIDDLLVHGITKEQHDERLKKVLERCKKINLKLNKEKCRFGLQEIKYLGHRISKDGVYPDDTHLTAIKNMQIPQNRKDVERFLGLITYVGNFVPNLSDKTLPLRELLKKETEWHWNERHEQCMNELKSCLSRRPVLKYYSMHKPITISVDASSCGLGACLMQENLPVCYASKALTKTEQRYAQIEKELYACVFACERFNVYIYGRNDVTIETDHKPLISIIKKPIVDAPSRLQRMLLRLQRYTFKLIYKPGKHLYIADTLSRAFEPNTAIHESENSMNELVYIIEMENVKKLSNHFTDSNFIELQKQTENDNELMNLKKYISKGWPNEKNNIEDSVRPYWNYKEDLNILHGLVWKDNRIVVPKSLRKDMLKKLHIGHMGLEKCKLRARELIFWPGMNNDLQNMIYNCDICLTYRKQNQKEELQSHELPDRPWAKIGIDLFQIKGRNYLLLIDYYSKFFELTDLYNITTSEYVVKCLKNIFSRQGIPETVISDCGPQFVSNTFRQFASEWNFIHKTSSPHYPQSNGQVERTVQTVKNIMIKTNVDHTDYRLALLEYLNTPLDKNLASPAELLQSRKLRSILPTPAKLLKPKAQINVQKKLIDRQNIQKMYYDRNAKNMSQLKVGQKVKVWDIIKKCWISGVVTKVLNNRSYEIRLDKGNKIVRNRRHIIKDSYIRCDTTPDYNFEYDHICTQSNGQNYNTTNNYITRFGRTVKRPNRWGYGS